MLAKNPEIELILRSLELYGYNLEYMSTNSPEIADKIAILQFTYEQILSSQASQVNGRTEKPTLLAENLHKSNVISLTPKKKSEKENLA